MPKHDELNSGPLGNETGKDTTDQAPGSGDKDRRRREILGLLTKAAVAGPVLMTLKSTPARAATGSAGSGG